MRIAMLGHKRVPSREGGVEIVVEELGARMVHLGHEVTCYNRRGDHVSGKEFGTSEQKEYRGMTIKSVPTIDVKGIAAMSASFFAAVFAAFGRYDVVHFHAEGPCAMLWLPKLLGKRCIATIHGLDHQRGKWGKFAKAYILLGEKCAARFADEIIVLSRGNQEYFKRTYGRDTVLIPNGVNAPEICEAREIAEKYGLEKDGYVLFLGRLVPEKGVHYLIEAFKKTNTDKKLVIAGGASDSREYFDMLREAAKDDERIIFTDFVQGRTLQELYSNAYIYVLPSDVEGMPISLLEAMSYGNCCLTSDIEECAQVIGSRGCTFKHGDAKALFERLNQLLLDPEAVEKYKVLASDVCGIYTWDAAVNATIDVYDRNRRKV